MSPKKEKKIKRTLCWTSTSYTDLKHSDNFCTWYFNERQSHFDERKTSQNASNSRLVFLICRIHTAFIGGATSPYFRIIYESERVTLRTFSLTNDLLSLKHKLSFHTITNKHNLFVASAHCFVLASTFIRYSHSSLSYTFFALLISSLPPSFVAFIQSLAVFHRHELCYVCERVLLCMLLNMSVL